MRRIDSSSIATQCSAMYARWSTSLNVRRQRVDQAADRSAQHDGITVQQHEARVGIHRGQRLEVERVVRALQRPPAADATALQHLQRQPVVLVRRPLIDAEQPSAVGRDVRDRLPRQALEVLAHQRDALGRTVGFLVVDRADPRVDLFEHVVAHAGGFDTRTAAKVGGRRWGNAVAGLPAQERAVAGVLFEQVAEERRAGAEHADHHDRRVDALVGDVGVLLRPVDDAEAVGERPDDVGVDRGFAELVELRFGARPIRRTRRGPRGSCRCRSRRAR